MSPSTPHHAFTSLQILAISLFTPSFFSSFTLSLSLAHNHTHAHTHTHFLYFRSLFLWLSHAGSHSCFHVPKQSLINCFLWDLRGFPLNSYLFLLLPLKLSLPNSDGLIFVKMGHSRPLLLYFCLFYFNVQLAGKILPMLGFERHYSGVGSNRSTD